MRNSKTRGKVTDKRRLEIENKLDEDRKEYQKIRRLEIENRLDGAEKILPEVN